MFWEEVATRLYRRLASSKGRVAEHLQFWAEIARRLTDKITDVLLKPASVYPHHDHGEPLAWFVTDEPADCASLRPAPLSTWPSKKAVVLKGAIPLLAEVQQIALAPESDEAAKPSLYWECKEHPAAGRERARYHDYIPRPNWAGLHPSRRHDEQDKAGVWFFPGAKVDDTTYGKGWVRSAPPEQPPPQPVTRARSRSRSDDWTRYAWAHAYAGSFRQPKYRNFLDRRPRSCMKIFL